MNWARAYRRRNPVCGRCGNALAEAVHHIVPIATDPSRVFDETNVVGLCHPMPRPRPHQRRSPRAASSKGRVPTVSLGVGGGGIPPESSRGGASVIHRQAQKTSVNLSTPPPLESGGEGSSMRWFGGSESQGPTPTRRGRGRGPFVV